MKDIGFSGHNWSLSGGEKCELCGDKDWMADKYCSSNPQTRPYYLEWVESLRRADDSASVDAGLKD